MRSRRGYVIIGASIWSSSILVKVGRGSVWYSTLGPGGRGEGEIRGSTGFAGGAGYRPPLSTNCIARASYGR
jgi:hypothetical protein